MTTSIDIDRRGITIREGKESRTIPPDEIAGLWVNHDRYTYLRSINAVAVTLKTWKTEVIEADEVWVANDHIAAYAVHETHDDHPNAFVTMNYIGRMGGTR